MISEAIKVCSLLRLLAKKINKTCKTVFFSNKYTPPADIIAHVKTFNFNY